MSLPTPAQAAASPGADDVEVDVDLGGGLSARFTLGRLRHLRALSKTAHPWATPKPAKPPQRPAPPPRPAPTPTPAVLPFEEAKALHYSSVVASMIAAPAEVRPSYPVEPVDPFLAIARAEARRG